jgi:hypothetical protein
VRLEADNGAVAPRRNLELTWPLLLAVAAAVALVALGVWIVLLRGRHDTRSAPKLSGTGTPRTRGCVLAVSPYGYPSSYITRRLPYTRHPPLPQKGWHDAADPLAFRVLFHSVFHGYAVVEYRPDVPAEKRARLQAWVRARANERVTASPAPASAPLAVDVAEWGHELQCATADTLTPQLLDRFLSLRGA